MNLYVAWIEIFLGFALGAVLGLFFHQDDWLGGYDSWRRRMLRLAHISFFGIALINLCFFVSLKHVEVNFPMQWPSWLLIIGAFAMPAVCLLSAYHKNFRHLFFIPAGSLLAAAIIFLYGLMK